MTIFPVAPTISRLVGFIGVPGPRFTASDATAPSSALVVHVIIEVCILYFPYVCYISTATCIGNLNAITVKKQNKMQQEEVERRETEAQ